MANASVQHTHKPKTIMEKVTTVSLTLSLAEAETLLTLVRNASGHPLGSRRRHTDGILVALRHAGVTAPSAANFSGSIHFDNEPDFDKPGSGTPVVAKTGGNFTIF